MYIADDMGLGKTIQALATAAAFKEEWPLLVVCPSSMRFAWKDAALRWIPGLDPEDVTVITSGKDYLCNGQMLVISYDLLSRKESELLKKEYKVGFHIWRPSSSLWTKQCRFCGRHMSYVNCSQGSHPGRGALHQGLQDSEVQELREDLEEGEEADIAERHTGTLQAHRAVLANIAHRAEAV